MIKSAKVGEFYNKTKKQVCAYIKVPRILFTDEKLKTLSVDAKILYSLLCDRISSASTKDDEGRDYIYCPAKEVCEMLGCSKDKALKVLAELENYDRIGLIARKKHGQGRPANIYVKKIEVE